MQRRRVEPERTNGSGVEIFGRDGARMVEYHRQSVKIGEEPVVLMNTPESIRAMFSEAGVGMTFEHQEPAWSEQQLRDAVTTILQTSDAHRAVIFEPIIRRCRPGRVSRRMGLRGVELKRAHVPKSRHR